MAKAEKKVDADTFVVKDPFKDLRGQMELEKKQYIAAMFMAAALPNYRANRPEQIGHILAADAFTYAEALLAESKRRYGR